MESSEITRWNRKVRLFEMTENVVSSAEQRANRPVSFWEGIALHLSKAFLEPEPEEERPSHGYTSQRAA